MNLIFALICFALFAKKQSRDLLRIEFVHPDLEINLNKIIMHFFLSYKIVPFVTLGTNFNNFLSFLAKYCILRRFFENIVIYELYKTAFPNISN
jgi:hypothetical protein